MPNVRVKRRAIRILQPVSAEAPVAPITNDLVDRTRADLVEGRPPITTVPRVYELPPQYEGGPVPGYTGGGFAALQPTLAAAARANGLPESWASSPALGELLRRESSFNPGAQNPTSTAYGLFQFLDKTWGTVGATKTADPYGQALAGLRYIQQRYGTPEAALAFHTRKGWY